MLAAILGHLGGVYPHQAPLLQSTPDGIPAANALHQAWPMGREEPWLESRAV